MFKLGPKKGPLEDAWIKVQRLEACLARLVGRLGGPDSVPGRSAVFFIGPSFFRLRSRIEEERRNLTRMGISSRKSTDDTLGSFREFELAIGALPGSINPPLPAKMMKETLSASRKLGATLERSRELAFKQGATKLLSEQHTPAFRAVQRAMSTLDKKAARALTPKAAAYTHLTPPTILPD